MVHTVDNKSVSSSDAKASELRAQLRRRVAHLWLQSENDFNFDWPDESVERQLECITEPHSGDCTKQPWTCVRCAAEDAYKFADGFLARLDDALAETNDHIAEHVADAFYWRRAAEQLRETLLALTDTKAHLIVSGAPGALYGAGWAGAMEYVAKIARGGLAIALAQTESASSRDEPKSSPEETSALLAEAAKIIRDHLYTSDWDEDDEASLREGLTKVFALREARG